MTLNSSFKHPGILKYTIEIVEGKSNSNTKIRGRKGANEEEKIRIKATTLYYPIFSHHT
jgi:hypothetical protein